MILATGLLGLATVSTASSVHVVVQDATDLRVGHWVEVRGELASDGSFRASAVEVTEPQSEEVLIGTAERVDLSGERFRLLGRTVRFSEKTEWRNVAPGELEGERVKVEGHWRRGELFSARTVSSRKEGRERISGRVDSIQRGERGLELSVQGFRVWLPEKVTPESEIPLADLRLAPEVEHELAGGIRVGREDWVPTGIRLTEDLSFGALLEYKGERRDNYDLEDAISADETRQRYSVKGQVVWAPSERFHALLAGRVEGRDVRDQDGPDQQDVSSRIDEVWGYWSDALVEGFDVQAGRMNFEDQREWIYRKKLDGARFFWRREDVVLELSATTVLSNGSDRNEHTDNLIGYLSKGDEDRELALWVVDRRDDRSPRDYPIHFGARALGDWIPQNESWAEASLVRGYSDNVNLKGWAFDLGTTWSPPFADPFSFTAGWALASGDDPSTTGTDEGYRQTGLQRNNGKFGGVTSFRYYGEVADPELSNLSILTLGLGARPWRRTSVDLVWHGYHQVEASTFLRNSDLDRHPDGVHEDLGQEVDLVLGTKVVRGWDFEVVLGRFDPGSAFPGGDPAWLATFQVRFRF